TDLAGRLAAALGEPFEDEDGALTRIFPTPDAIARADVAKILGMPRARGEAIRDLARAVASGALALDGSRNAGETLPALVGTKGGGEWPAQYVAMRALGEPDAFPAGDLGLRRALKIEARELAARAEAWRPWRAYAAMHLWTQSLNGAHDD